MATGVLGNPNQEPVERLTATYLWILRNAGEQIAYALTTLAKGDNLPAMAHCSAGVCMSKCLANSKVLYICPECPVLQVRILHDLVR